MPVCYIIKQHAHDTIQFMSGMMLPRLIVFLLARPHKKMLCFFLGEPD
jgi:hypothetical protein